MGKTVADLLAGKNSAVWSIDVDATVYEALAMMATKNLGALLVLANGELAGIVSERDYARKVILLDRGSADTKVHEIMTSNPVTISPSQSLDECMRLMTEHRFRHLPVVEDGSLGGVVSIGDVVKGVVAEQEALIGQLEESITAIESGRSAEHEQRLLAESLGEVSAALNSTLELDDVLDLILERIAGVVPFYTGTIMMLDGEHAEVVRAKGFDTPIVGLRLQLSDVRNLERVLQTGEASLINDTEASPDWTIEAETAHIKSAMTAAIQAGGRVVGAISVDSDQKNAFTDEMLARLEAFADLAGNAVGNAGLYRESQEALAAVREQRRLTRTLADITAELMAQRDVDTLLDFILERVSAFVAGESVTVLLIRDGVAEVVRATPGQEALVGEGLEVSETQNLRQIVETRRPHLIRDTYAPDSGWDSEGIEWMRSNVTAPIMLAGEVIGFLSLSSGEPDAFPSALFQPLESFSTQVGMALHNARLFDESESARAAEYEQRLLAEALGEVSATLNSTLELDDVLDVILDRVASVVPFSTGTIMMLDGEHAEVVRAKGFDTSIVGLRLLLSDVSNLRQVMSTGEASLINDTEASPDWTVAAETAHIKSAMTAAIQAGGRVVGAISVDSDGKDAFSPEMMVRLRAFADQTGNAIQNAQLYQESESRAAELAAIGKISAKLVAESELESTIQLIGTQIRDIFDADIAYVALLDQETNLIDFPYQHGIALADDDDLTRQTLESGKPLLINEEVGERVGEIGVTLTGDEPLSILNVPIETPNGVIGVISVQSTRTEDRFDDDSLRLMTTIASNAGAALHNAQLFSEALEHLRQVELLTNAASAIEQRTFEPEMIETVAGRTDALGELARVFANMAQEVRLREQRLRRQLEELQLDIEENELAKAETVAVYIPMDRRHALANGTPLPEHAAGAALFADVSGFTPLTESLAKELGLQRGAEEVIRHLNRVYTVLIDEVHRNGGSVIGFSGDAITCWFNDLDPSGDEWAVAATDRAVNCALMMQAGMEEFGAVMTPAKTAIALAIKVAIAAGPARRFLVGGSTGHQMDVLAGQTLLDLAAAEHVAGRGEIVIATAGVTNLKDRLVISEQRDSDAYAVVDGLVGQVEVTPWPALLPDAISDDVARPWLLPAVFEKVQAGQSDMLSELRPVVALFLKFGGLDYDDDEKAGRRLSAFVEWIERTIAPHNGSVIQLTVGDKGSYLYAAFGAPVARSDDAVQSVLAALKLAAPPETLSYVTGLQIGLAQGQMRVGAYGGSSHRTYGAIGDKTNLAARLMQAAAATSATEPADVPAILCDSAIYEAAHRHVQFDVMPPILVKGKEDAVDVFRPVRVVGRDADEAASSVRAIDGNLLIGGLPPAEQLALKVASVIGDEFSLDRLSAIYPDTHKRHDLLESLQALGAVDLLVQVVPDSFQYRFKDRQVRDGAYSVMLFAQRRQLHRSMAELLEQAGDDPQYAEIARHWQAAEEIPKAVTFLEKAGEQAREQGDLKAARQYFSASLALNP